MFPAFSKTRTTLPIYTCMPCAHLSHSCSFELPNNIWFRVNSFETVIIKFSLTSCHRFSLDRITIFASFLQYPQMKYNLSITCRDLTHFMCSTRLASYIPLRHLQWKHLIKYKPQPQSDSIFYLFL
jgi:hypothetical protein